MPWKYNVCWGCCRVSGARGLGLRVQWLVWASSMDLLAGQAGAFVVVPLFVGLAGSGTRWLVILSWVADDRDRTSVWLAPLCRLAHWARVICPSIHLSSSRYPPIAFCVIDVEYSVNRLMRFPGLRPSAPCSVSRWIMRATCMAASLTQPPRSRSVVFPHKIHCRS